MCHVLQPEFEGLSASDLIIVHQRLRWEWVTLTLHVTRML